ncbi:MAG: acyl-CoA dehydrogenase, partial [Bradyrhizobium sp.]
MNVQQVDIRDTSREKTREQFILDRSSFPQRIAAVAAAATAEAEDVDRGARFPQKAIEAARAQRLLGVQIPKPL